MAEAADITEADPLPLQQFLTYRLARVQAKLNAQASRILKDTAGLSLSQWRILSLVGAHGEASSSELTRLAAIDKGLFSRKLKTLVQDGLVTAEPDPSDHRVARLKLTAKGDALYRRTLPTMQKRQKQLRADLDETEAAALYRALDKLEAAAEG